MALVILLISDSNLFYIHSFWIAFFLLILILLIWACFIIKASASNISLSSLSLCSTTFLTVSSLPAIIFMTCWTSSSTQALYTTWSKISLQTLMCQ